MSDFEHIPGLDPMQEIDVAVKALVDSSTERIAAGETVAEIAQDPNVRSVLDYILTANIPGDTINAPEQLQEAADHLDADLRLRYVLMDEPERDAAAINLLEGLIDLTLMERIK